MVFHTWITVLKMTIVLLGDAFIDENIEVEELFPFSEKSFDIEYAADITVLVSRKATKYLAQ